MCIGSHHVSWVIIVIVGLMGTPFAQTPQECMWAWIGAILPDFADIVRWAKIMIQCKYHKFFYKKTCVIKNPQKYILETVDIFLHSIWMIFIVFGVVYYFKIPTELVLMQIVHIILDIMSHKQNLIFWPISTYNLSLSKRNWWEWKIYEGKWRHVTPIIMVSTSILVVTMIFIYNNL